MKTKFAFTLAEVLITLGIIGVIAGMTIPTLMHNIQNQQLQTQFTKAYSVLSQAVEKMKAEEGQIWVAYNYNGNYGDPNYTSHLFNDNLQKYFKVVENCGLNNCMASNVSQSYMDYTNTAYFNPGIAYGYHFTIQDGMLILPLTPGASNFVGFYVDTNGYGKGPNKAGYDLFMFELLANDILVPEGVNGTYYNSYFLNGHGCSSTLLNKAYNGMTCAANAATDSNYFKNLP